jgi:hypothetical protein
MKSLLREALSEAIEFVEMDLHVLTPAGEAMVQRWRDALSAPDVGVGLTRYAFDATTFMGHASAVMGEDPNGEWVRHEDAAAALAAERRRAEADMRERAAQAIEDASADAPPVVRDAFNLIVRGLRTLPLTTETDHG